MCPPAQLLDAWLRGEVAWPAPRPPRSSGPRRAGSRTGPRGGRGLPCLLPSPGERCPAGRRGARLPLCSVASPHSPGSSGTPLGSLRSTRTPCSHPPLLGGSRGLSPRARPVAGGQAGAHLAGDLAVVKVVQGEGPLLPAVLLHGHVTLQLLDRQTTHGCDGDVWRPGHGAAASPLPSPDPVPRQGHDRGRAMTEAGP